MLFKITIFAILDSCTIYNHMITPIQSSAHSIASLIETGFIDTWLKGEFRLMSANQFQYSQFSVVYMRVCVCCKVWANKIEMFPVTKNR